MQVSSVYNYLSDSLVPKKRNTAHNSSELKEMYNNISKYNKNLPLYKFSLSQAKQTHVINIKEAALTLTDVAQCFANSDSQVYTKKALVSDNENSITGSIRTDNIKAIPDMLEIKVNTLASNQINQSNYLPSDRRFFSVGTYDLYIDTVDTSAHYNLKVASDDTNYDIQSKIVNMVNNNNLGIKASMLMDANDNSAISFESLSTGDPRTDDGLYFTFNSRDDNYDISEDLGLNNVITRPSNSIFEINGETHSAETNHISVNQVISLDFHNTSTTPTTISFVPDTEIVMNQIDAFVDAYNSLIDLSLKDDTSKIGKRNLFNDISSVINKHRNELEACGLNLNEDNKIEKDEALLVQNVKSGQFSELFNDISSFKTDISSAANRLTLDPMAYIDRLIVTYPNTNVKRGDSYNTSVYSGLIYNNYA